MSSSKTPCAACKTLRRKCIEECVFAPHFPPNQPHRFESVHRVYGASNVAKILSDLPAADRAEAVTSLVYEAEARLKDPVYGCVGSVSILQHRLKQIQTAIQATKQELATYIGPSALSPGFMPQLPNQQPIMSGDALHLYEAQRQRLVDAHREQDMLRNLEQSRFDGPQLYHVRQQQLVEEQNMLRNLELEHQHQQQQAMELLMLRNRRFDGAGSSGGATQQDDDHLQQFRQHQLLIQQQNQPNHGDGDEER